jgi:hypothetical protein
LNSKFNTRHRVGNGAVGVSRVEPRIEKHLQEQVMKVDREGIFFATVGDHGIAPRGQNKLTAFTALFNLIEEMTPDGPADISPDGIVTDPEDFYLEKKDGGLNEGTIRKLREATGWDGIDPFWLEDHLPPDLVVKLTIEWDTPSDPKYKPRLRVKWIDHKDAVGSQGVVHLDKNGRSEILNKLRGPLRAIAGGTAVKPAAPPTAKPSAAKPAAAGAPAASPAPAATPTPAAPRPTPARRTAAPKEPPVTLTDAFNAFVSGIAEPAPGKEDEQQQHVQSEWSRVMNEMYPGKADEEITSDEWKRVRDESPAKYMPF